MYDAKETVTGSVYIGSVSKTSIDGGKLSSDTHVYTGPLFKPTELTPIEWVKQAAATGEDPETDVTITYYSNHDIKFDSTTNQFVLERTFYEVK